MMIKKYLYKKVYTWSVHFTLSLYESKQRSHMMCQAEVDSLAALMYTSRKSHKQRSRFVNMAGVCDMDPGGHWFNPGGDHANLCLVWCTHDVRLAHMPCLNAALVITYWEIFSNNSLKLFEAIFINSQSKICFTLWAFAYCLLQASSDWRWLAVDGVSAVLKCDGKWELYWVHTTVIGQFRYWLQQWACIVRLGRYCLMYRSQMSGVPCAHLHVGVYIGYP